MISYGGYIGLLGYKSKEQSIPKDEVIPITFKIRKFYETEDYDGPDTKTNISKFVAPITGVYSISGQIRFKPTTLGTLGIGCARNGQEVSVLNELYVPTTTITPTVIFIRHMVLKELEYVELYAFHDLDEATITPDATELAFSKE